MGLCVTCSAQDLEDSPSLRRNCGKKESLPHLTNSVCILIPLVKCVADYEGFESTYLHSNDKANVLRTVASPDFQNMESMDINGDEWIKHDPILRTHEKMLVQNAFVKLEHDRLLQREPSDLASARHDTLKFLARAFEIGFEIEDTILADLYAFYSQDSGDISESQMLLMLTECNKAFVSLCYRHCSLAWTLIVGESDSSPTISEFKRAYLEQAQESQELFQSVVDNLTTKDAILVRERFFPNRYGGVISLEAFTELIGWALFPDQFGNGLHWNRLLLCDNNEDFVDVLRKMDFCDIRKTYF